MLRHALYAALAVSAVTGAARADILNESAQGYVWFCWTAGDQITCTNCDRGEIDPNRTTCDIDPGSLPERDVLDAYVRMYKDRLADSERRAVTAAAHVGAIDDKLLEFMQDSGEAPVQPELLTEAERQREELVGAERRRVEIRDQIRFLQDEIAADPNPDYASQMVQLQTGAVAAEARVTELQTAIMDLYTRYVEANSRLLDATVLEGLRNQRRGEVDRWEDAREDGAEALDAAMNGARLMKMLQDDFIYDHRDFNYRETIVAVRDFGDLFEDLWRAHQAGGHR